MLPILVALMASPIVINAIAILVGLVIAAIALPFAQAFLVNQVMSIGFLVVALIIGYTIVKGIMKGKVKPIKGFAQIGLLLIIGFLMPELLKGLGLMSITLPVMSVTGSSIINLPFNIPTTDVILFSLVGYAAFLFWKGGLKL